MPEWCKSVLDMHVLLKAESGRKVQEVDLSQVRSVVADNASQAFMADSQIAVGRASFGGIIVRVVHENLSQYNDNQRRAILLQGVEDVIEIAELITPEEEKWYGSAFTEDPYLPLWAEALARQESDRELRFVSDLDADPKRPAVVTFYSLRGGVGRTTALANAARTLASRGRRVLCIDMDLEAPGLSTLLGLPEPSDDKGSVSLLLGLERGDNVDIREHVQRVTDEAELYCVPAGRVDVDYAERLRLIDPEIWYREPGNPLHRMLDLAATSSLEPDIILLDARTGISPANAPLLFDVSDLAVVCFFPHLQARRGTGALVRALLNARSRRSSDAVDLTPEPRFLISPLPPGPSAARVEARALEWIEEWLAPEAGRRPAAVGPLSAEELVHAVSYSPEVAFRDSVSGDSSDWSPYSPIVDWLEQLLPASEDEPPAANTGDKKQILTELHFSPGAAETQETLVDDYVITRVSSQALSSGVPLVIGRKGTGKTAVFRWLLETADPSPVPICCPHTFLDRYPWVLSAEGFKAVEREFEKTGESWRSFWPCYIALALYLGLSPETRAVPPGQLALDLAIFDSKYEQVEIVGALRAMLAHPDAALLAGRWLQDCNERQPETRLLLFDGLDTGFGGAESRDRRKRAVEGLLGFSTEIETRLPKLSFKIMLRADIWQQLRFDNKSHLFGRSVQLAWRDQADYFKTALKQAVRSGSFAAALGSLGLDLDVAEWDNRDVFRAWNVLVGERMKGGKTTFTRNWVWNRLADGQGDHGPRSLSQLFHEAVDWEKAEELRNPYGRSFVRPRALVPSLDVVSEEALQALAEEFPELGTTIDVLTGIGRTPVDAGDLTQEGVTKYELELAREIGLLAVYEGTAEDVRRYRVPDLYRRSLGMTRKGQA